MAASDHYSTERAPLIERLARIEGQSNFLSLLAGIEAGPDTTQDMAALAFSRGRGASRQEPDGAVPEILEAHVVQSDMFKRPLMSMVWHAVRDEFAPKEKDWPWIQGAIADAFLLMQKGRCKPVELRARQFRVDKAAYGAMRNLAYGVFLSMQHRSEREYQRAMRSIREVSSASYDQDERGQKFHGVGSVHARPSFPDADKQSSGKFEYQHPGLKDRSFWDDRNAAPGPVTELQAQPMPPR